jgi:hypothetical protein
LEMVGSWVLIGVCLATDLATLRSAYLVRQKFIIEHLL